MFGLFSYLEDFLGDYRRYSRLCAELGDVVAYGRHQLSHPHHGDQKKRSSKAKARRLAKTRRRRR